MYKEEDWADEEDGERQQQQRGAGQGDDESAEEQQVRPFSLLSAACCSARASSLHAHCAPPPSVAKTLRPHPHCAHPQHDGGAMRLTDETRDVPLLPSARKPPTDPRPRHAPDGDADAAPPPPPPDGADAAAAAAAAAPPGFPPVLVPALCRRFPMPELSSQQKRLLARLKAGQEDAWGRPAAPAAGGAATAAAAERGSSGGGGSAEAAAARVRESAQDRLRVVSMTAREEHRRDVPEFGEDDEVRAGAPHWSCDACKLCSQGCSARPESSPPFVVSFRPRTLSLFPRESVCAESSTN